MDTLIKIRADLDQYNEASTDLTRRLLNDGTLDELIAEHAMAVGVSAIVCARVSWEIRRWLIDSLMRGCATSMVEAAEKDEATA
jgi:hypothetical protein